MQVKVAQQQFKRLNQLGLVNEWLFWLRLKAHCDNGNLGHDSVKFAIAANKCSRATALKYLRRLIELGWIEGQRLISYDRMFEWCGYDVIRKRNRCAKFVIFKIGSYYLDCLKFRVAFCELQYSLQLQTKKVRKFGPEIKKAALKADLRTTLSVYIRNQELSENFQQQDNGDVALSCLGLANLVGYGTASKGHTIQRSLVKLGWIATIARRLYVGIWADFKNQYAHYIDSAGVLWMQLPNKIIIL